MALAIGACGGDETTVDGGPDATASDVAPLDAAPDSGADAAPVDASPDAHLVLGVVGDYGVCSDADPPQYSATCAHELGVASLVHGWQPDAIITVGDNSYGSGTYAQLPGDQAPYDPDIDAGRFFPAAGNHDWLSAAGIKPSLDYFHLKSPYYVQAFGSLVTFFILDTNAQDDAGITATSAQAAWFDAQIAQSTTPWNVVVNHQAPYSSCGEGSNDGNDGSVDLRWVAAAKADVVLSGHSHVYERLARGNYDDSGTIPYVVMGVSGAPLQGNCGAKLSGQQKAIYGAFGALRLDVTSSSLTMTFVEEDGGAGDTITLTK